jgi:DNA-dependent RNA polymerase auxiliary subunit epsilon
VRERWIKAGLICTLLLLGACSSTSFVYNRLDFIVPWYADDYVDLDAGQREQLDEMLVPFLAWHRQQELPRYIELLDDIQLRLDRPLAPDDVAASYAEVEQAWIRLQGQALAWVLELGDGLTDEQVEEFLEELQDQQLEYEKKYLRRSEETYRQESYDNFKDSLQDNLGRLDKAQRQRLLDASEELRRSDAIWLREREIWLQRMGVILQREPGWQEVMREAIQRRDQTTSSLYLETFDHNLQVVFAAVADVLNSRTPKQDKHLRSRLADLREELESLLVQ